MPLSLPDDLLGQGWEVPQDVWKLWKLPLQLARAAGVQLKHSERLISGSGAADSHGSNPSILCRGSGLVAPSSHPCSNVRPAGE